MVSSIWAASLQLNDPDPLRWAAMYLACAAVALCDALERAQPYLALSVAAVALTWAVFILPELVDGWKPADLTASMVEARPEIEYGREFCGLLLVAGYCGASGWRSWRRKRRSNQLV